MRLPDIALDDRSFQELVSEARMRVGQACPEWSEHNSNLLEVQVYDREESVAFIRRRAPRLTHTEADQLAAALEDLPLPYP